MKKQLDDALQEVCRHRAGALFVCDAINTGNQTQDLVSTCDIVTH